LHTEQQIRDTVAAVAEELGRIDTAYLREPLAASNGEHGAGSNSTRP
jgi:hypothetical protein